MKNILKSTLLLALSMCIFSACDDDRDLNPVIKEPTAFYINTPAIANSLIDLANSDKIVLTAKSQPNYGFPTYVNYKVIVSLNADMSNAVELDQIFRSGEMEIDGNTLASALTNMECDQKGKEEADFPMTIPVYLQARAYMVPSGSNDEVEGTSIVSTNVVTLSQVYLEYSLPAVHAPEDLYIVGKFNGWSWADGALTMVHTYDGRSADDSKDVFWHMVYIDNEQGIKFNKVKNWDDGTEVGYNQLNSITGDLASEIVDNGGNIASSVGGWYLMIVTTTVSGRDILYDVQFNKPQVWLIGVLMGGWDELMGEPFSVPETADGDFVSPEFTLSVPGNDTDGCVRAYVKIPGFDWWKSEFMVFDNAIVYRGTGGDQERVGGEAGQHLYLNFTKETGSIK